MSEQSAKFTQGSTMRHILVMSGAGSIGLMALFVVDLLDMLFISMLGQVELAAAVGFAGTLTFFSTSISIGTSIAMGALVSKAIGAKQFTHARALSSSIMLTAFLISCVVSAVMFAFIPELLAALGAKGFVAERAQAYLQILLPSGPILALGMAAGAGLRAAGDAKRSMWATLSGGIVNAILDPIFIFVFLWNVEGAAFASVIARCTVLAFSLYPLIKKHDLVAKPSFSIWRCNTKAILAIAVPAIITNIATPIGNAIVTSTIAPYGEDFVAGLAVIGRLTPVCFAVIFALSGAVGPIIGQNFGAERFDRVKETLNNSLLVTTVYTLLVCVILYFTQQYVIQGFSLTGDAALIVATFCTYVALSFIFNGMQFVANTSFNNLGKPLYSTALNLGKATLGTLPFVYFGSHWFGALGVLYGQALGSVVFGLIALWVLQKHIRDLMQGEVVELAAQDPSITSVNTTPFCSHDAVLIDEVAANKDFLQKSLK
ncbi:multi antimicrobial extrusion protein MatE [Vibrio ichthyoenteri ATCC 700023]|uniref:Multidrug resistance protein NorM n=1 Tax=Vibrio ichthyoenteri ATCC 700023 TaxID=870968 RepID=F9S2U2_9VIBR|nr:MATE family efflux transporter [Vibrio ichthyoenteri]EGU38866.1 multi antimicrobial extrusion protein MatE [Vibrio ichthyoenteri ATCC 700023]